MVVLPFLQEGSASTLLFLAALPGADRKRSQRVYRYCLTFRNPDSTATGCVLTCEVQGGRLPYQIAVERDPTGKLQLHCTCADAVFRAETEGRYCKHVHGLLAFGQQGQPPLEPFQARGA